MSLGVLASCAIVSVTYDATDDPISKIDRNLNSVTSVSSSKSDASATTRQIADTEAAAETDITDCEIYSPVTTVTITGSDTVLPVTDEIITLVYLTSPVSAGSTATIKIHGKPGIEYNITVYYKSGASRAAGLEPKISDSSGNVSWSWIVGSKTSTGTFKIVITGDNETFETPFTVEE